MSRTMARPFDYKVTKNLSLLSKPTTGDECESIRISELRVYGLTAKSLPLA